MSMKTIGMMAIVAMLGIVGIVTAEIGEDSGKDCGSAPSYVMSATQNSITIENWGTAPGNVGGLRLITKVGNVATDVAKLPWTAILRPEPFPTKGVQNNDYKITVAAENLTVGDTVYSTNGVGNYATCVVA